MDMTRLANALRYFLLPEDSILTRPEAQCFAGGAASTCKTVIWIALLWKLPRPSSFSTMTLGVRG